MRSRSRTRHFRRDSRAPATRTSHQGQQAELILQNWAQQTENALIAVSETLEDEPATPSTALGGLADAASALRASAIGGRAAFAQVAALDPELADALEGSSDCRELQDEQP